MSDDIDTSPEAVEHIRSEMAADPDSRLFEVSRNRLEALLAALTQSRAETAAAYERAAQVYIDGDWPWHSDADDTIRALVTPDQTTALDRMVADAEARGMQRAAVIAYQFEGNDKLRCAILAAIPKGGDA